jgi:hypothetical protein
MKVFLDNFSTGSVNSITEASYAIHAYIDDYDLRAVLLMVDKLSTILEKSSPL